MENYCRDASVSDPVSGATVHRRILQDSWGVYGSSSLEFMFTDAVTGLLLSPCIQPNSQTALYHWLNTDPPNQDAKRLLADILGAGVEPESPAYNIKVAAELQEVVVEEAEGDIVRHVEQFSKASNREQAFRLLRCAAYLASNNLLLVEKADKLLEWIMGSNNFWVVEALVAMRTPTTDAFASVLLVSAVRIAGFAACHALVNRGVDPNSLALETGSRDDPTSTALMEAVERRDTALVRLLVDNGAEVNGPTSSQESPLSRAVFNYDCEKSYQEIIRILLEKGADIHQRMNKWSSRTISEHAIIVGNFEVTAMPLQMVAASYYNSKKHLSPLHIAAKSGNATLVEKLLKAGANVDGEPVNKRTPDMLQSARCGVMTPLQMAIARDRTAVVELLLREGADVNKLEVTKIHMDSYEGLGSFWWTLASPETLSALQMAAFKGNVSIGRQLINRGARLEVCGGPCTVLQAAASKKDNLAFVKLLLDNGADINAPAQEPEGRTALQAAAESGGNDTVLLLLQHDANINAAPSRRGFTALQAAARRCDIALVQQMIQWGADINAPAATERGRTALQIAVELGDGYMVDLLLKNGANVAAPGAPTGGRFTLELAAQHLSILRKLLNHGKDTDILPELQKEVQALFRILCNRPWNSTAVIALLREYGINANRHELRSLLLGAVRHQHLDLAKELLNSGADASTCSDDSYRRSIIKAAVSTNRLPFCDLFIKSHADLKGNCGTEALCVAVASSCCNPAMAEYLLSKGASPNFEDPCEANLLPPLAQVFISREGVEQEKSADMLLQHGAKVKGVTFPVAVCGAPLERLKQLIGLGLEVNRQLPSDWSLLQHAVGQGREDLVELLLNAGADVNAPPFPTRGNTALQSAVFRRSLPIAKLLLSKGADVNGPPSPKGGATALQQAVLQGSLPFFFFLLNNGADVNAPAAPQDGWTALEAAAERGRLDMAQTLLRRDKDPETLSLRCQQAAALAASNGFPILARVFREWRVSDAGT